ncbi:hypothetical protein EPO17_01100 [Patescibacteria group bacterium]|nr:MAG: hypothetical protein EPO17_01100 [Patescibacteria group bacterium]
MTRQQALGVIGLWTIILPFFGIPNTWKLNLVILTGVVILVLYWHMRKESQSVPTAQDTRVADFVENTMVQKTNSTDTQ